MTVADEDANSILDENANCDAADGADEGLPGGLICNLNLKLPPQCCLVVLKVKLVVLKVKS